MRHAFTLTITLALCAALCASCSTTTPSTAADATPGAAHTGAPGPVVPPAAPAATRAERPATPSFDRELAARTGADERGMRSYILVVLKTGPTPVPAGKGRDEMFKGHFANIKRLADEGTLVLAGPFDGVNGWRGLFVFAVGSTDEARRLTETDPVIRSGEMVAEYHQYYGSAALMLVNELHEKIAAKRM